MVVDVRSLDADFLVAYSHKVKSFPFALEVKHISVSVNSQSVFEVKRINHGSDVWAYRHWVLTWLKPSRSVMTATLRSFTVEDVHPTDIATFLDQQHGLAIRSGHHCAQALHRYLGVNASARASLHFYNTKEDFEDFIWALSDTIDIFCIFQVESCIRRRTRI